MPAVNFTYQAGSWTRPRRVVAKVEWHPLDVVIFVFQPFNIADDTF
jgi:hypothetical protein